MKRIVKYIFKKYSKYVAIRKIQKRLSIFLIFLIGFCGTSVGQKKPLTPDLVVEGGYFSVNFTEFFPEKIEGEIKYEISKDDLQKNISTFIFLNKHEKIMEKDGMFVFYVKNVSVGTGLVSTPVGVFSRSKSLVSFVVTIYIFDNYYKYLISDIVTIRRVERVDGKCIVLAPEKDLEKLRDIGFNIETVTVAGIDLPTKGELNTVHRKRVAGMIAERNGYVNLCINQAKTIRNLKDKWVEKINRMDSRLYSEVQQYEDEFYSVQKAVNEMNEKINE